MSYASCQGKPRYLICRNALNCNFKYVHDHLKFITLSSHTLSMYVYVILSNILYFKAQRIDCMNKRNVLFIKKLLE